MFGYLGPTNIKSHRANIDTAKQLRIPGWEDENADVRKLVQDYLSTESAGQWLLVLGNVDDINMWITKSGSEAGSSRLIYHLPQSGQGCIAFTSHVRKTTIELARHNVVEVSEMNEDGIDLLSEEFKDDGRYYNIKNPVTMT